MERRHGSVEHIEPLLDAGAELIGAASIVIASAAAATIRATMRIAVTQGETPCSLACLMIGAKVVPIRTAASTGSRIGRQK